MTLSIAVQIIRMFAMLKHDILIAKHMFEGRVNPVDGSLTNLLQIFWPLNDDTRSGGCETSVVVITLFCLRLFRFLSVGAGMCELNMKRKGATYCKGRAFAIAFAICV